MTSPSSEAHPWKSQETSQSVSNTTSPNTGPLPRLTPCLLIGKMIKLNLLLGFQILFPGILEVSRPEGHGDVRLCFNQHHSMLFSFTY